MSATARKKDAETVNAYFSDLRTIFAGLANPQTNEMSFAAERDHQMVLALPYINPDDLGIRLPLIAAAMPHNFHGVLGNFEILNVSADKAKHMALVAIDPERSKAHAEAMKCTLKEATVAIAQDSRFQGLCASVGVLFIILPDDTVIDLTLARKPRPLSPANNPA